MSNEIWTALISSASVIIVALIGLVGQVVVANKDRALTSPIPLPKLSIKIFLILMGCVAAGAGIFLFLKSLGGTRGSFFQASSFPAETTIYDFEDGKNIANIKPWRIYPQDKKYQYGISGDYSHNGSFSVRAQVSMGTFDHKDEYCGIGISSYDNEHLTQDTLLGASGWVYIPASESTTDITFRAHMYGYIYDRDGNFIESESAPVNITAGKWTPLFWGSSYEFFSKDFNFSSSDQKVHELYISVWSDKPYVGSVYFDDIRLYRLPVQE